MGLIVVTGSASGIGAGCVAAVAADGHGVVAWDIAGDPSVDVADESAVAAAVARLPGPIDGAVLAAGVSRMARLVDTTTDDWETQMRTNAFGVFNCLRALIPVTRRGGSIVVISSVGGLRSAAFLSAYCASKSAAIALVQAAAVELGPSEIRVNAVCPMYVRTAMQDREVGWEASLRGISPEEVMTDYIAGTPMGRIAQPAEIADVVRFLIGPQSRFMTGASVTVSGGADLL